ncbi:hypothetical protein ACQJBY_047014 [Aegilops geniculata]
MTPAVAAAEWPQGLEDRRLLRTRFLAVKSQIERTAVVAVQSSGEEEHPAPVRRPWRHGEEAERKATGGPVKVEEAAASSCSPRSIFSRMCSVRAEEIAEDHVDVDARGVDGRGGGLEERDEQRIKQVGRGAGAAAPQPPRSPVLISYPCEHGK